MATRMRSCMSLWKIAKNLSRSIQPSHPEGLTLRFLKLQWCSHPPGRGTNDWGTIRAMIKTLLALERHLYALVIGINLIQGTASEKEQWTEVRTTATDERFIEKRERSWRSLVQYIALSSSNHRKISQSYMCCPTFWTCKRNSNHFTTTKSSPRRKGAT